MAITNKDYIVFTLGALIGAGAAYFVTKKATQKKCYEDYVCSKKEEEDEALEPGETAAYVITDTSKKFNDYTDRLEEKREEAQRIAAEQGYIDPTQDREPYLIDAAEFANGLPGYSSTRINWYPSMNMATNETDDEDATAIAEGVCGLNNIREIENGGDSFGHIRNDEKKTDVEVFICYADWPLEEPGGETD